VRQDQAGRRGEKVGKKTHQRGRGEVSDQNKRIFPKREDYNVSENKLKDKMAVGEFVYDRISDRPGGKLAVRGGGFGNVNGKWVVCPMFRVMGDLTLSQGQQGSEPIQQIPLDSKGLGGQPLRPRKGKKGTFLGASFSFRLGGGGSWRKRVARGLPRRRK